MSSISIGAGEGTVLMTARKDHVKLPNGDICYAGKFTFRDCFLNSKRFLTCKPERTSANCQILLENEIMNVTHISLSFLLHRHICDIYGHGLKTTWGALWHKLNKNVSLNRFFLHKKLLKVAPEVIISQYPNQAVLSPSGAVSSAITHCRHSNSTRMTIALIMKTSISY